MLLPPQQLEPFWFKDWSIRFASAEVSQIWQGTVDGKIATIMNMIYVIQGIENWINSSQTLSQTESLGYFLFKVMRSSFACFS